MLSWLRDQGEQVVHTEQKISPEFLATNGVEFIVSYGYRHKITKDVLTAVARRAINLHISYLPWNRGADPNFWSFAEDTPKGVTIHFVDEGIDTGDIVAQRLVAFDEAAETLASSYTTLQASIEALFKEIWSSFKSGTCGRKPQHPGGTHHKSKDKVGLEHLLAAGWDTPVSVLRGRAAELPPDAIVVLAHLMEQDGTLGVESRARADKAADLARRYGCPIVCMGWNYRDDTSLCVSEAIASYLRSAHGVDESSLILDLESRDTVGDAIFSKRKFLHLMPTRRIIVVTSDYHVDRTQRVFSFVYGGDAKVSVVGAPTDAGNLELEHEQNSLAAFRKTFAGVSAGDDSAIFDALRNRHPFYNGTVHPALAP